MASPGPLLATRAPDLRDALERASKDGFSHVILDDGKIIACDPVQGAGYQR